MEEQQSLETLKDIKRMMERSSRFISLSGLSGISAGVFCSFGRLDFMALRVWLQKFVHSSGCAVIQ